MKKIFIIGLVVAFCFSFLPQNVFASSFNVYISPASSSITVGDNIVVSVRINPNSNAIDSVQAGLVYDNSKLQYVSYSAGAFTTFQANNSGNTFSYVGTLLGSSVSADSLMYSVNFKSIGTGSASLSLTSLAAAYQGSSLALSGSSSSSVNISAAAITTPPVTTNPPSTTNNPPAKTNPAVVADKTAPKLNSEASVVTGKNTITISFNTDEEAKIESVYYIDSEKRFFVANDSFSLDHNVSLGLQEELLSGMIYVVEITATDKLGNSAIIYSQNIQTKGIDLKIKITDLDGKPLANHPVEIHSDPKSATTDKDGFAIFYDITPGNHTLVFDVDGLTFRQPIEAIDDSIDTDGTAHPDGIKQVKLPIKFASVAFEESISEDKIDYKILMVSVISAFVGAILVAILNISSVKMFLNKLFSGLLNLFVKK